MIITRQNTNQLLRMTFGFDPDLCESCAVLSAQNMDSIASMFPKDKIATGADIGTTFFIKGYPVDSSLSMESTNFRQY